MDIHVKHREINLSHNAGSAAKSGFISSGPASTFLAHTVDVRRTSLHGKPIPVRQCRTDVRYRRLQAKIYNFLERPKTWKSMAYHVIVFACVFVCLQLSVLSTLKDYEKTAGISLFYLEMAMLFWFFAEYCIRVWCAGCRSRYQTWRGRLRFMHRPFCLVDATVIIASIVVLSMGTDSQRFAASPLRGLRFFQILRMIRMDRRGGSWKLLASVVWAHRQELFTTVYIGFLTLISGSFLVYLLERDSNEKIQSYADALWWGVVTLCTVGYGDTVPKTWMGKMVAACCAVAGISFFALPAGILGSGFALKVQQHQREKHLIRRRVPAAMLIQSIWRCYAADVNSTSVATWKVHMCALKSLYTESAEKCPSRLSRFATVKRLGLGTLVSSPYEADGSPPTATSTALLAANTLSCFGPLRSAMSESNPFEARGNSIRMTSSPRTYKTHLTLNSSDHPILPSVSPDPSSVVTDDGMEYSDEGYRTLSNAEKNVIRAIRKIKFFIARRKFKEALRPYDVKDVIEQYSAGHLDMLGRIKILQSRLDHILGRTSGKEDHSPESQVTLSSRIIKIEQKVISIEAKLNALLNYHLEKQPITYEHLGQKQNNVSAAVRPRVPNFLELGPNSISSTRLRSVPEAITSKRFQSISLSQNKATTNDTGTTRVKQSAVQNSRTQSSTQKILSPPTQGVMQPIPHYTMDQGNAFTCAPVITSQFKSTLDDTSGNARLTRIQRVHFSISPSENKPTTSDVKFSKT
uniref:Potassium voltage-gated channel subfamily KQT member 2 n=1 Tax=Cryptocotyle lingua TaxID=66766 RepID=A0A7U0YET0_9TREM|nr:potassium voltage-gated channel subfamily KQT member 2 [Cryptocotyle lingua]